MINLGLSIPQNKFLDHESHMFFAGFVFFQNGGWLWPLRKRDAYDGRGVLALECICTLYFKYSLNIF
jgi:hypothetical protein